MKRVLTTISYYTPHLSGLTICAQRLITHLTKKDFTFTILTSKSKHNQETLSQSTRETIIQAPTLFAIGKAPIMPTYPLILLNQLSKTDLVWIHLPQLEGIITAILAKLFRKPIVSTVHCLPLLPSGWSRKMFQKIFDLLSNLTIRLSDQVIYYTKDYAENTKELLHIPSKSHYILPPILPPSTVNDQQSIIDNHLVVGFAGRTAEDKGIEYLIQAIQKLIKKGKRIKLIIAGPKHAIGEKKYQQKINNLINQSNINIKFTGSIKPNQMHQFYKKINVLVLPSVNRTEAFGIVQAEAMLHGIPVIASNLPGVRIPIKLTGSGTVVPAKNVNALTKALLNQTNRKNKKTIATSGHKAFSLRKTTNAYTSVFRTTKN